MKPSKWPLPIAAVLLGAGLAVVTQSKPHATANGDEACAVEEGCMQCVPDNCGTLAENQYLMDADDEYDDRCVEYDGVPPSHCAIVTLDMKLIYETNPPMLIGDCAIIDCANGNPTSTECSNPWVRPDIGWGLEARSN